jgi:hypothetical protein
MKLAIKALILSLLLMACSGQAPEYEYDELGNVTQELITQVSTTDEGACAKATGAMYEFNPFQGLTYTASTCMAGDKVVYVPRTKTVSLKTTNGGSCTTAQFNAMVATVDTIIAELNTNASIGGTVGGWSFSRTASGTHTVTCVNLPTSPLGGNSIRNYSRAKPVDGPQITDEDSVFDGAAVYGWSSMTIQIDVPDVYAKGANATEDARILWHAVAAGIIKLTGTGEHAGNRMAASDQSVSGAAGRVMFSNGERCRARNYATTQNLNLYWVTSAACQDN